MKRMHIHVAVDDLAKNIGFYSAMFGQEPAVVKDDYAKWMLDDPRVNFAISNRGLKKGVDHLGLQVESDAELAVLRGQMAEADIAARDQTDAACCYANSNKYWTTDPQGIAWETFHTLGDIPTFGKDAKTVDQTSAKTGNACCAPAQRAPVAGSAAGSEAKRSACC